VAKKAKKKIVRREYTKADVKELRAHSKARTPIAKIVKLTKRTEGSLRQKALRLGISIADSSRASDRTHLGTVVGRYATYGFRVPQQEFQQ